MDGGEEWLLRPVLKRMCQYESLKNGMIDIADILKMNIAIDVEIENQNRMHKANED